MTVNKGFLPYTLPGEKSPNWTGGRKRNVQGYILVKTPDHPFCNSNGYVYEQRLVMEKHLGHYLDPKVRVHHINGNRGDNRIENLVVLTCSKHAQIHHGKPGADYSRLEDKDWLEYQHKTLKKSIRQIARTLGCSHVIVLRMFKKHGMTTKKG